MRTRLVWALCLATVLCRAPLRVVAGAPDNVVPFSDISGHWAQNAIAAATATGYVSGYPDGTFRPDAPASRAEAVAFIVKALAVAHMMTPVPKGYTHMPIENAAAFEQHWAVQGGYLPTAFGTHLVALAEVSTHGDFDPDAAASRPEAIAWLARAAQPALEMYLLLGRARSSQFWSDDARQVVVDPDVVGPWPFTDNVAADLVPYAMVAYHGGIVHGYPDGRLGGPKPVTRAEFVAMLQRLAPIAAIGGLGNGDAGQAADSQHGAILEVRAGGMGEVRPLRGDRTEDQPAIRRLLKALSATKPDTPREALRESDSSLAVWVEVTYADGTVDRLVPLVRCTPVGTDGRACNPEPGWILARGQQSHSRVLWEEFFGQLHFDMPWLVGGA